MGGLGSLLYLKERHHYIKGVYLISPFLGYEKIVGEINEAGGLDAWQPGIYVDEEDWERMLWHWIKDEINSEEIPPVILGYGLSDEYEYGQLLLAKKLGQENVYKIEGGHDFETFKQLWTIFLDAGYLSESIKIQ